jgi:hypothetical protein
VDVVSPDQSQKLIIWIPKKDKSPEVNGKMAIWFLSEENQGKPSRKMPRGLQLNSATSGRS